MFVVTVDASGPIATLHGMVRQLDHFGRVGIGQEMSEWQTEDMHRKRPFTKRNRSAKTAATLVRPHSRYEVNRSRNAQRRIARRARKHGELLSLVTQPTRPRSTRPILRAELVLKLHERMSQAMREKLQWRSKGKT
jgi:hypothetical protein